MKRRPAGQAGPTVSAPSWTAGWSPDRSALPWERPTTSGQKEPRWAPGPVGGSWAQCRVPGSSLGLDCPHHRSRAPSQKLNGILLSLAVQLSAPGLPSGQHTSAWAATVMRAVCRHTDECSGWLGRGRSSPPASGRACLCHRPPVPPTVSLLSAHPCPPRSPAVLLRPQLLPADARLRLYHLRPLTLLFCLPPVFLFFPSLGSGKNTAHFKFLMGQCGHEAAPALCQDFPSGQGARLPNSLHSGAPQGVTEAPARPGEDSGSGSFLGGQEGPPPRVQLVPRHSSQSSPVEPQPAQRWEVCLETHQGEGPLRGPPRLQVPSSLGWESKSCQFIHVHTHTHTHVLNS